MLKAAVRSSLSKKTSEKLDRLPLACSEDHGRGSRPGRNSNSVYAVQHSDIVRNRRVVCGALRMLVVQSMRSTV